ncbi:hypothetical protein PAA8504_04250 [Palleronia abyssalis]|uniref:Uncharacterized protein n=1 Tax=Palleronia abyssalis TaxID=1501240 RepID=A0A2R8C1W1_9RHOB|nr:ribbon-helix-helix protein, CopG family [Palleronia abyssalis]SPJ26392.1 hypothetical protein PAA8504_04250 [Palleronia abyssalis]
MKSRGRPQADTTPVLVRVPEDMLRAIDDVRRKQEDVPTRPEMIRRLLAVALEHREQQGD